MVLKLRRSLEREQGQFIDFVLCPFLNPPAPKKPGNGNNNVLCPPPQHLFKIRKIPQYRNKSELPFASYLQKRYILQLNSSRQSKGMS
jgi:hypothetical protein